MSNISMKEMLAAGLHFGHQTQRWNPKMKPYIYGARNGIYIINLDKTLPLFNAAFNHVAKDISKGGNVLFVGTKKQARHIIKEEADRCNMFYVDHRWLGGMLTNFQTIKKSVDRLKHIESMIEDGSISNYKKKEALRLEKELIKLKRVLGGIKNMRVLPSVVFVIDTKREKIAIDEANKLGIPVIAIADTNSDPDGIKYLIPGNDDAIKSIKLISSKIADAVLKGKEKYSESEQAVSDKELAARIEAAELAAESAPDSDAPEAGAPAEA